MSSSSSQVLSMLPNSQPFQIALATLAITVAGSIFAFVLRILNISERRWKLRAMKHKPFRQLLKNDNWRKASRLDFHAALQDAFGRSLEPVEFAFIQTRRRPLDLLKDRFAAGRFVRLDASAGRYEWQSNPQKPPRALFLWANALILPSIFCVSLAITLSWQCVQAPSPILAIAVIFSATLGFLGFVFANALEAADRLLRMQELHAIAEPIPKALVPRTRVVPSKRKRAESDASATD